MVVMLEIKSVLAEAQTLMNGLQFVFYISLLIAIYCEFGMKQLVGRAKSSSYQLAQTDATQNAHGSGSDKRSCCCCCCR